MRERASAVFECCDQVINSFHKSIGRNAAQLAEVGEVLARGESRIEADVIEQSAEARIVGVDRTAIGSKDARDHAERRGFAGAVGTEESGDGAVGCCEGQVADG